MAWYSFLSGVNTSFSSELNNNFNQVGLYTYFHNDTASVSSTSTSYVTVTTHTIPADTLEVGNVIVNVSSTWDPTSDAWDTLRVQIDGVTIDTCDFLVINGASMAGIMVSANLDITASHTITVQGIKTASNEYQLPVILNIMGL